MSCTNSTPLDPTTGLAKVPDGLFFRVNVTSSYITVTLRRKRWRGWRSSVELAEKFDYYRSAEGAKATIVYLSARLIEDYIAQQTRAKAFQDLNGDYPPKKL